MGFLVKMILIAVLSTLFLAYSPTLVDFQPQPYTLSSMKLTGPLEVNSRLSDGERLFEGKMFGPESLAVYEGSMYTGTMDGCITKITGNKMACVAQVDSKCEIDPIEKESTCSRPLGLRFDKKGLLYVADSHKGVYTVNVKTGEITTVLSSDTLVGGKPIGFADDLDIDDSGTIYLSDATTKNPRSASISLLEHENSGRVIKYDQKTRQASVLADGLYFPNGIQISNSGDSLLIAETGKNRIHRYYLKGQKKGQREVFAELPGNPDNLRPSKQGYWVALIRYNDPSDPGLMYKWSRYPLLRKVVFRLQHAVGSMLSYLHQYWKSSEVLHLSRTLREGRNWLHAPHPHGMAVEIDENGKIIRSIQSPDGKHSFVSEVLEHDGYLYAGSFINPYLIKIKQK